LRFLEAGDVEREVRGAVALAEKHDLAGAIEERASALELEQERSRYAFLRDDVQASPDRHDARAGFLESRREPRVVSSQVRGAIETRAGVEQESTHGDTSSAHSSAATDMVDSARTGHD